jgi:hypothetical protein
MDGGDFVPKRFHSRWARMTADKKGSQGFPSVTAVNRPLHPSTLAGRQNRQSVTKVSASMCLMISFLHPACAAMLSAIRFRIGSSQIPSTGNPPTTIRMKQFCRAFAFVLMIFWSFTASAVDLPNGEWRTANRGSTDTIQVPAGQALLRFEVSSARIVTVENLPANGTLLLTASINANPTRESSQYRIQAGVGRSGVLEIRNPPAGLYWFRLFTLELSGLFIDGYQVRATYYPPPPSITCQPQGQTLKAGTTASFHQPHL